MKGARWGPLPLLVATILAVLCACTAIGRADVHLTICIEEDLRCSVDTEVSAPPFSDWLLSLAPKRPPSGSATAERRLTVRANEREGRQYAALAVHFDDIRELQTLVNSKQPSLQILPWLSAWAEGEEIGVKIPDSLTKMIPEMPVPLTRLAVVMNDESPLWTVYEFEAEVDADRSAMVGSVTNMTYHAELPGLVTQTDAHHRDGRVLSWDLVPGQALSMHADSRVSKAPGGNSTLWVGGGVLALAFATGLGFVLYWTLWRVRRPAVTDASLYCDTLYDLESSLDDDEDLFAEYGWESIADDADQKKDDASDSDASDLRADDW